ncbi:adenylate/guanylate cyclase domain-containing protein [bacterium]|nr:adenylate/guanylate cyclase domain-containing protein [bacterium]
MALQTVPGTIVFTDLVGFTEFTAANGDEAALALVDAQEGFIREAVNGHGRIIKTLGDGLMLFFDDPCRAIQASLKMQEMVEAHHARAGLPLWMRIGVHHGHAMVRHDDLVGHDVNLAARVVDLAGPGEVLATEAAVSQVRERIKGVDFEEMGPMLMKGIPDPVMVYTAHTSQAQAIPA